MGSQETLRLAVQRYIDSKNTESKKFSRKDFCFQVGMQPENFSSFMNGRRFVGERAAKKYFRGVLASSEWTAFRRELEKENHETSSEVRIFSNELTTNRFSDERFFCDDRSHQVALASMELDDYDRTVGWVAHRLGLNRGHTLKLLDRLVRLKLAKKTRDQFISNSRQVVLFQDVHSKSMATFKSHLGWAEKGMLRNELFVADPQDVPRFQELAERYAIQVRKLARRSASKRLYSLVSAFFELKSS